MVTTFPRFARLVALLLLVVVVFDRPVMAGQVPSESKLRIKIEKGKGAINNLKQRTPREVIVKVEDENNKPVGGAVVIFTLPDEGASGLFPDSGGRTFSSLTNTKGRAAATFEPNSIAGEMRIRVDAAHLGNTATETIIQTNKFVGMSKLLLLLGIGAAAAGTLAVVFNKDSESGPEPRMEPTIDIGMPTVSAPR